ncbi:hypothetical protein MKW94_019485 [Papaver nudicaule]|uniref:Uncharacterized protein n=1 Tax=Papaver nudicaule TaxID=74823 RepID=A0AA41SGY0_PAPNU|nr:hypothetical protein [Papaver nudicaule]
MNSLVSLKGLGEDPWFRMSYDINPAPKEIFLKQQRKDNGEVDVSPRLTMTQYSGKQLVSPIQAISSDLEKSIPLLVGAKAPRSSKEAHKNVNDSRKRKSHHSDRPEQPDDYPQPVYCSDKNIPLSHRSRHFICELGFLYYPSNKDLFCRVISSKGHMPSDAKVKSMYIQVTMVAELPETIQQMSELSSRDVTSIKLQRWRATVDTASAIDFHVSWLDDQLHLLESQIRDVEEQKRNEARRAYEAAKVDKAELIAKVATLKASLASFKANNMALTHSALGSCLATPH